MARISVDVRRLGIADFHYGSASKIHAQIQPLGTRKNTDRRKVSNDMVVVYFPQLMKGMSCLILKNSMPDPLLTKEMYVPAARFDPATEIRERVSAAPVTDSSIP